MALATTILMKYLPHFLTCDKNAAAVFILLLIFIAGQVQMSQAQQAQDACATQLTNLNTCSPFVVPGTVNAIPSIECCAAVQSLQKDCLCNTLRVAARIPASCRLPPLNCGA